MWIEGGNTKKFHPVSQSVEKQARAEQNTHTLSLCLSSKEGPHEQPHGPILYLSLWASVFCWQAELLLPAVILVPVR